ncbi:uncharacterized protein LOC136088283 [Hydra vulgaris]|uniref:Uncharacterized protein LOC136088283 n=1 Tax=Hydra vulgaris TaxID=6087 RepID=A0ABM4D1B5_HYDVU
MSALSVIRLKVNGMVATALVDTGCSKTILNKKFLPKSQCRYSNSQKVVTFEGNVHQCTGSAVVILEVDGIKARDEVILVDFQPFGVDMMLGMTSIKLLGGVSISPLGKAKFGLSYCGASALNKDKVKKIEIKKKDHEAVFNGVEWGIKWKWRDGESPDRLRNKVAQYGIPQHARADYREWRRMGNKPATIDLRKAYLQLKTDKSLWPFQTVVFRNKRYCLTRLGFGLNVAPMIMKSVVSAVIDQDELVKSGTSAYVDDIFVDESVVSLDFVKRHFLKYGLESKEGEQIGNDGVRVLGLCVRKVGNKLMWSRGNRVDAISQKLTRRVVFSICGQLVGHLPVCGWLRVICSLLKRKAVSLTKGWDDEICDKNVKWVLKEVFAEVERCEPACGDWAVCGDEGKVWVDASSLAMGALIQVGKTTVEDATWLRKETSDIHINMAELDAVIRGMNMALMWKLKKVTVFTDSVTVFLWVSDALTGKSRLRSKATGEMLIRRRLSVLQQLIEEYNVSVEVKLIPSKDNLADALARVRSRWLNKLTVPECRNSCMGIVATKAESISDIHQRTGHFGVNRTLNFVRKAIPTATENDVRNVIKSCEPCQSIDPAPIRWEKGNLDVEGNWERLAMDITHYGTDKFLSLIDCGPSKYALWRHLSSSYGSLAIVRILRLIFCERGAPSEILTDNEPTFKTKEIRSFLDSWGVQIRFRAAYYPEGNGIVERNHRTIKRIAERSKMSIPEALYWYNVSADKNGASPIDKIYSYTIGVKGLGKENLPAQNVTNKRFRIGDKVWLKPPNARCYTKWQPATITRNASKQIVEVNGIPRHVKHVRPRNDTQSCIIPDVEIEMNTETGLENAKNQGEQVKDVLETNEENVEAEDRPLEIDMLLRRSGRERRMPSKYFDCYFDDP